MIDLDADRQQLLADLTQSIPREFTRLRQGRATVSRKADGSVVTTLDVALENFIVGQIAERFPEDVVLGEETAASCEIPGTGVWWAVDPIDGTANLVKGLPFYASSVAVGTGRSVAGGFVAGLSSNPQELRGGGPVEGRSTTTCVGVDVENGRPAARKKGLLLTGALLDSGIRVRTVGCASIGLLWVSKGWLDAYVHLDPRIWDYAAGAFLVKSAGGVVFSPDLDDPWPFVLCGTHETVELVQMTWSRSRCGESL